MILAKVGDTPYNIMLLLHILSAIVAFAPTFVHPLLGSQGEGDSTAYRSLAGSMAKNGRRIYTPALILTGVLGFGLAGMSDEVFKVSQTWLILAVVVWIALCGIVTGLIVPAERAIAEGDDSKAGRLNVAVPAVAVLLVVTLWLMIWKPFLDI